MSEISKEELLAMMEVQSKTATAMENIANSIRLNTENLKEITKTQAEFVKQCQEGRMDCQGKICGQLEKLVKDKSELWVPTKATIDKIKEDTFWMKIIFGSITFIIAIALGVQQFIHWLGHK